MSSPVRDPFGLVGTVLERRFAIDRAVARGGFGVVYQGQHLSLRKTVAMKVLFIPKELDALRRRHFLDGFAQEAQTIAQLEHPAIVRVLDFGISRTPTHDELPWMVLEWVEGTSLADYLKNHRGQPLSPADAMELLRPVFHALAFAHGERIAHRDVKPSNIMLVARNQGSQVGAVGTKLLDFGIAKVLHPEEGVGSGETHTHALFSAFSLPYASPEQKVGMKTGPWTDVHALGLILTEMLTGYPPYPGNDRLEIEHRVTAPVRPTPALFGIDVGLWEPILARAVALRSNERFQNAKEFLHALDAVCPPSHSVAFNVSSVTEPTTIPAMAYAPVAPSPTSSLAQPDPSPSSHGAASHTRSSSAPQPPIHNLVSPSTITGSPAISAVKPTMPPSRRGILITLGVACLLAAIAAFTIAAGAFGTISPPYRVTPQMSAAPLARASTEGNLPALPTKTTAPNAASLANGLSAAPLSPTPPLHTEPLAATTPPLPEANDAADASTAAVAQANVPNPTHRPTSGGARPHSSSQRRPE